VTAEHDPESAAPRTCAQAHAPNGGGPAVPRLTPTDLSRYRADYHQCGVTITPLLDEIDALTAERDAETKRAEDWANAHARDSRCPKCSHPFGPIGRPKGLEEDGYECVWQCPCDCHADVPALRAEIARLQRQVEGHCERIAAQAELLSKCAEKGSEALTAERDRLALAAREALALLRQGEAGLAVRKLADALEGS
jgi:hypothetical protein